MPNAPSFVLQEPPSAPDSAGNLQGVVTDLHGGLVPRASITLERKGQTSLRETTSDSAGHFAYAGVPAGSYTLLVSAPELQTYLSAPFTVQPGQHLDLPAIALGIASANTSISVSANSTAVAEQELNAETRQRVLGTVSYTHLDVYKRQSRY